MEKAKDSDFEGLIDFLVRELAINDWNKGMEPASFLFVSLGGEKGEMRGNWWDINLIFIISA